jgi:nitroreductase
MGIYDVMNNCRAMRRLKPDEIPEKILVDLIEAANKAATASNTQPCRWIIARDPEVKQKLADINRDAIKRFYPAPDPNAPQSAFEWQMEHMQDIPALVIACIKTDPAKSAATFIEGITIGGSIWPAIQNLLLAARASGLGACPTTLPLADRAAAKAALGVPEGVEPICLIPVGYPMGKFGPVTRLPVSKILHWDRW